MRQRASLTEQDLHTTHSLNAVNGLRGLRTSSFEKRFEGGGAKKNREKCRWRPLGTDMNRLYLLMYSITLLRLVFHTWYGAYQKLEYETQRTL